MASAKGGPGRNLKWGMPTKVVRVPEPMVDDVMEWIDENAWRYRVQEETIAWEPITKRLCRMVTSRNAGTGDWRV